MKTVEVKRPGAPAEEAVIKEARRRQRRRQFAIGAGVVLALAGGLGTVAALRGTSHPRPPSAHHSTHLPKQLPAKMTGLPMPAGTNLQFLLATVNKRTGKGETAWYSTASRRTEPIAGLPPDSGGLLDSRVEGGWSAGGWLINLGSADPPVQGYFIADGSLTATRIGAGFQVQASDRAGAVWLVSYPRSTDNIATTSAHVQLVSTTGQPLGPRYRLPAGYLLSRGVGNYLLLYSVGSGSPHELWDPRTRQVVRRIDNLIAAGPNQIAWSPICRNCYAQVLNLSTGKSMTIPISGQLSGIFSDDGRLLAVQLPNGGALGVFDTETGALTVIPGTALRNDIAMSFWWQDGGHRLVVMAAPGDGGNNRSSDATQVAYWQPGDIRLRVATIQIPGGMSAVKSDWQY